MNLADLCHTPGEHRGFLPGHEGKLEACFTVPDHTVPDQMTGQYQSIALLGHPHSLKGGSMQNKVVTTLAKVFKNLGIPSLRFNFRGVGESEGLYDAGLGESDDMLALSQLCQEALPDAQLLFAGFSFGSFVAYRAAAQVEHGLLLTIAPPVNHFDFTAFPEDPTPWVLVQGDEDEVIPANLVLEFAESRDISVIRFADTGHFFHGKLIDLQTQLLDKMREVIG
ncbi:MAG: hypothetical protein P1U39_03535 [Legionellaceae bacterium]|nr:hypothetical protein [Legionellaceae bacterium]